MSVILILLEETRSLVTSQATTRDRPLHSARLAAPRYLRPRLRRTPDIDRSGWHTSPG
jgi:hypothetical protein